MIDRISFSIGTFSFLVSIPFSRQAASSALVVVTYYVPATYASCSYMLFTDIDLDW